MCTGWVGMVVYGVVVVRGVYFNFYGISRLLHKISNTDIPMSKLLLSTPRNMFNDASAIHIISYGDQKYNKSKQRLFNEALDTNWFYSININSETDLNQSFCKEFNDILIQRRGGGYWMWKFDIILRKLQDIKDDEYLVYVDSGCTINKYGKDRLQDYINMINNSDDKIISFQMCHLEKHYTTNQIFDTFGVKSDNYILESGQYVGGILIMQKTKKVINIFTKCLESVRKDHNLITDKYNSYQSNYFKDNRHDQSILSVVRKIDGSIVIEDETYIKNTTSFTTVNVPFLATRKRG